MDGRLPRAAHLQPARRPAAARARSATSTSSTTTRRSATALLDIERDRAAAGRRPSTTRSPSTAGSTSPPRRRWRKRLTLRRWYGFLRMQAPGRPPAAARSSRPRSPRARDIVRDFGVDPARIAGDPARRRRRASCRRPRPRVPGRIVAMASADAPMKGIATLLEAFAKLRTERDVELLLVTKPEPGRPHRAARRRSSAIARPGALRARHQRRRAGRADGLRRDRLRARRSTRASRCRPPS